MKIDILQRKQEQINLCIGRIGVNLRRIRGFVHQEVVDLFIDFPVIDSGGEFNKRIISIPTIFIGCKTQVPDVFERDANIETKC